MITRSTGSQDISLLDYGSRLHLNDGMDGMCAGNSAIIGVALGILAYVSSHIEFAAYLNIMYIPGSEELVVFFCAPSLQIKLFKEIQKNGYSVRKVEEMVQRLKSGEDIESGKKTITAKAQMPEEFTQLKNRLSQFLNTKVQFTCSAKGKGKISIPFANEEELEHIMNVFDQLKQE